jgi:FixJ family two-component response regulator
VIRETVYIVDDDADVRESARALLESYNLTVQDFASAQAFLEGFKADCKACLLLDLNMPEMGGLELLEQLRRLKIAMPVIIVTAQADPSAREDAHRAGAFAFFEKPVDASLLATIDQALNAA